MNPQLEIIVLGVVVASACAIPGVFLVLRRMSLMSDAISHSVLFGIVIGFFLVRTTDNPLLILTATLSGVLTVWLVETILRTHLVKEDAAIGLVFPVLFSIGVILISREASQVHIDEDAVLLGELAFAPFNRMMLFGLDIPRGLVVMGLIFAIDLLLVIVFYKELKLATFDAGLAAALGFSPALIHYGLMTTVSITAVGAFDHVGAILVVAFMIAPPAAAYLLTDRLDRMVGLAVVLGALAAVTGYGVARQLDVNISAAMATMTGLIFLMALFFAPRQGYIAQWVVRRNRRKRFAVEMLVVHLSRHEGEEDEREESSIAHLVSELSWSPKFAEQTWRKARSGGYVTAHEETLHLTPEGRQLAQTVLSR